MKKLLIYTLLSLLLYNSCKKEDPPKPTDSYYMSAELKSYYFFPKGSWWVYKRIDTTAEIYDTATVVRSESKMIFNELAPFEWEYVAINIEHTHYPSSPRSVSPYLNVFMRNESGFVDRISMTSQGELFSSHTCFFSVPIDSTSIFQKSVECGGGGTYLLDTNKLLINNNQLNNCVHVMHKGSNWSNEIWITKYIGIIKYQNYQDNTEWELINYEIKN